MTPPQNNSNWYTQLTGWRGPLIFGVLFTLVVGIMVAHRAESSTDFRDFWENANHFRQTGKISADLGVHNYLPFFTIFMTPWSLLPLPVAAVAFAVFSLILFALSVYLVERLLYDGPRREPRLALFLAVGLMLPYVYSCAVVGNLGLLLLCLIVVSWFLVERGDEWTAGITLGLATLIKLLPGLLVVFFLLKGRWRVAAAAFATTIVLGLGLPLATIGPQKTISQHRAFIDRAVQGHSAYKTITADKPPKFHPGNHALPIVLRRVLTPLPYDYTADHEPLRVNIADLPRNAVFASYLTCLALLGISTIVLTFRGSRRWPPAGPDEVRRLRSQFGIWCTLMLLASPLVWTHYLPLVYWPLALTADRVERGLHYAVPSSRLGQACLLIWLGGAVLLAWPAARAAGAQLVAVLFLWLTIATISARRTP